MEHDVYAQQRVVTGERTVKEATYASELVVCNQACVSYLEGQGMTHDEIIEMAIQGHASTRDAIRWAINQEREACAKLIESHGQTLANGLMLTEAIRARGQA